MSAPIVLIAWPDREPFIYIDDEDMPTYHENLAREFDSKAEALNYAKGNVPFPVGAYNKGERPPVRNRQSKQ